MIKTYRAINDEIGYCFGIIVKNGIVINCAPVGTNKVGRKWSIVKESLELDNYKIENLN